MNTVSRADSPLPPYSPLTAKLPGKHHGFQEVYGARGGLGGKPEEPCSPAGADVYPHGVRGGNNANPKQPRTLREGGRTTRPMTYEPSTPEANAEKRENGADNNARNEKQDTPVPDPAPRSGYSRTTVDPGLFGTRDCATNDDDPARRHSTRCGHDSNPGRVDETPLCSRAYSGHTEGVNDTTTMTPRACGPEARKYRRHGPTRNQFLNSPTQKPRGTNHA